MVVSIRKIFLKCNRFDKKSTISPPPFKHRTNNSINFYNNSAISNVHIDRFNSHLNTIFQLSIASALWKNKSIGKTNLWRPPMPAGLAVALLSRVVGGDFLLAMSKKVELHRSRKVGGKLRNHSRSRKEGSR